MDETAVETGAELTTKDEALERLIALHKQSGSIHNTHALRREILTQEEQGNSAVSMRVAIPCVCHSGCAETAVSVITLKNGVDYGAPDKKNVKLIFMIAGKSGSTEAEEIKRHLLRLLSDASFTAKLCAAADKAELLELIEQREQLRFSPAQPKKRYDYNARKNTAASEQNPKRRLLFKRRKSNH